MSRYSGKPDGILSGKMSRNSAKRGWITGGGAGADGFSSKTTKLNIHAGLGYIAQLKNSDLDRINASVYLSFGLEGANVILNPSFQKLYVSRKPS